MRRRISSCSLVEFPVMANFCLRQAMRFGAAATVVRTFLVIALLVAAPVPPALALNIYYQQNANGQSYSSIGPLGDLNWGNWPNNNNWNQEQHTFIDYGGNVVVSAPSNWIAVPNDPPYVWYPGSPNDPAQDHDVFLEDFTVNLTVDVTVHELYIGSVSSGGILHVHDNDLQGISLTITDSLNMINGSIVNLDEIASLSVGEGLLPPLSATSLAISSGSILNIGWESSLIIARGNVENYGTIKLPNVSGNEGVLRIGDVTTFAGSGRVELGGPESKIYGVATGSEELINGATPFETHTISGRGLLGNNFLKLTNQGLIDANVSGLTLYVDPSAAGATNTGTMQASGGGILRLQSGTFTNTGGLIQALDGSQVQLGEGGTIVGGTLSSSGSGKFVVLGGAVSGFGGTITNNALVTLPNVAGNEGILRIADGTTLSGNGRIELGGPESKIYGVATGSEELINGATPFETHTISGRGILGNNFLKLTNQGLIDANLPAATLYVDPSASGATNTGVMQASEGGILSLRGGTFTNTGGLIQALDGSQVELDGGTIVGGTLTSSGNGKFVVPWEAVSGFGGSITNNALISMPNVSGNEGILRIADGTTLAGSGRIELGGPESKIYGVATGSEELINGVGHTISGRGVLGNNFLKLTNQGLIDANLPALTLYVDPSASGATNTGTMQASEGGTLVLSGGTFTNTGGVIQSLNGSTVQLTSGTFINTDGVLQALNGSLVRLTSGTINNTGGVIRALDGAEVQFGGTLVGGTLSRTGTGRTVIPNNTTLTVTGPITLDAPLEINSTGSITNLKINGNLTLSGSENVVLSNNTNNRVSGVAATDVLTLPAGRTISGAGQIGFNLMGLVNEGSIDANVSNPLTIDPSSAGVTNTGVLQASGGSTLVLFDGTFTNTGGVIQALDASQVQLNRMTLIGGTLSRTGTGRFVVPNNTTLTLSGPLTLNAPLEINSTGSITNLKINGNVTLSGSGNVVLSNNTNNRVSGVAATDVLTLSAGGTISGAGRIGDNLMGLVNEGTIDATVSNLLTIDPSSAGVINTGILQASGGGTLILTGGTFTNTGGVIQALSGSQVQLTSGTITNTGGMIQALDGGLVQLTSGTITNTGGVIQALDGSQVQLSGVTNTGGVVQALDGSLVQVNGTLVGGILSGAGTGQIVNRGILRGSDLAGLQLTDGIFDNQGTVEALNGSSVTYNSVAITSNNVAGVLTGGTWRSIDTGDGATITLGGTNNITQIAPNTRVVLSGAGSVLQQGTTPLESTLTTSNGTLQILDGRAFTMTNALNNTGNLVLGGLNLADVIFSTSTLTNSGRLSVAGGTVTVVGNVFHSSGDVLLDGWSNSSLHVTGDYSQSATAELVVEFTSAASFSQIAVSGSASLNGSLYLYTEELYAQTGDFFADFVSAGSLSGGFSNITGLDLWGGMRLNPITTATSFSLLAALPGDANLDMVADFSDLGTLLNNFNVAGFAGVAQWNAGDFNDDHAVEFSDLGILLNNFNQQAPLFSPAAPVPEPSTLALAVLGALGFVFASRHKRCTAVVVGHGALA